MGNVIKQLVLMDYAVTALQLSLRFLKRVTLCVFSVMAAKAERTFIAIKPDGVQRGLIGDIIKRFEQKGFRLVALKFLQVSVCLHDVLTLCPFLTPACLTL